MTIIKWGKTKKRIEALFTNQCTRFKAEVLRYQYKEKNMVDIMKMTVTEGLAFFEGDDIKRKLISLETVGLGYLTLGQPLNTCSGRECQRLKIAKELNKKGNIYLLDTQQQACIWQMLRICYQSFINWLKKEIQLLS